MGRISYNVAQAPGLIFSGSPNDRLAFDSVSSNHAQAEAQASPVHSNNLNLVQ
ncbi:hypothetical protein FRC11_014232, partial [Ceratobasidium sp. 423]